jgi:hypothetical protein
LISLLVNPCNSQEVDTTVDWKGYIIVSDDGEKEFVKFDVKKLDAEDGINYKISMIHNDQDYLFENLDIKESALTFKLDTGSLYKCGLMLQDDGSYSGECVRSNTSDSRKTILINMTPFEKDDSTDQTLEKNEE